MKTLLLGTALSLTPVAALAQQQQIVSPSQAALQADGIVNMLGQSLEKALADNQSLQKQVAELQKQVVDLKAKYEPAKKPPEPH